MSNLQKFLAALVERAPTNLSVAEMQHWIENGTDLAGVLAKVLARKSRLAVVVASALLTFIGTVSLPATTEPFEAAKKFVVDISDSAEVDIRNIGSNFANWLDAKKSDFERAINHITFWWW